MSKHDNNQEAWAYAKKKHRLSAAVIEMAKKLGLNPKKFGKIDNHKQEPWKAPLPEFIKMLYEKRFTDKQSKNIPKPK